MNRSELREQIRHNADMVGSLFVSDVELNALIDMHTRQLYDVLVAQYGEEYYCRTQWLGVNMIDQHSIGQFVAWPNQTFGTSLAKPLVQTIPDVIAGDVFLPLGGCKSSFVLAADFLRLLRVEFVRGTIRQTTIAVITGGGGNANSPQVEVITSDREAFPIRRIDTPGQSMSLVPEDWTSNNVRYRLRAGQWRIISRNDEMAPLAEAVVRGTAIDFLPIPSSQYAVQLTYVPKALLLADDTTQFLYDFPEFVIHGCAAACLEKERSDSSVQRQLQKAVEQAIVQKSRTPDAANPPMVAMRGYCGTRRGEGFRPW